MWRLSCLEIVMFWRLAHFRRVLAFFLSFMADFQPDLAHFCLLLAHFLTVMAVFTFYSNSIKKKKRMLTSFSNVYLGSCINLFFV